MKRVGAVLAASAVFCAQVTPAYACGPGLGYMMEHENDPPPPEYYPLGEPLRALGSYSSQFQPWSGEEDFDLPDQVRFNYPFKLAPEVGSQWEDLRTGGWAVDAPDDKQLAQAAQVDLKAFVAALGREDHAEAHRLAQQAVEDVLDMPAPLGQHHALTLRRAVEFLELESTLAKVPAAVSASYFSHQPTPTTALPAPLDALSAVRGLSRNKAGEFARTNPKNPRVASLQFVDMQEQLKQGLPTGWSAQDKPSPAVLELVKAVRRAQRAWLAAWPQHPLADLVRLLGIRLSLAEGDVDGAWKAVLSVYPRHRMRAAAEWTYLLHLDQVPKDLTPFRVEPYLRTALVVPSLTLSDEQWAREWAFAQAHAQEPWAVLLQERLLYLAATYGSSVTLPKGVPSPTAPAPESDWARLRMAVLLRADRTADVAQALKSLPPAEVTPSLRASLAMAQGHPQEAAQVKGLDEHARAYLLRTRLSDADLQALAQSPEAPLATEVAQVQAERRIALGDWAGAAAAQTKVPAQAARYEAMARLAADSSPAGQLALARALRDQAAALLPLGQDVEWYRSVDQRLGVTKESKAEEIKAETDRARAVLLAGNAKVLSLEAFARYLAAPDTKPAEARRVLKEADGVYNSLIGWDKPTTTFYRDALKDSDAAKAIRAAGLRLKNVK